MAIEDILHALEEQAQADIDAVKNEAAEHASMIIADAESEAARIRDGHVRQVERVAQAEASKVTNAARLEAKMIVSSARGGALDEAFEAARARLAGARDDAGYDVLFDALVREALEGIGGEVVVHVDPQDAARAQRSLASAGVVATIETDLSSAGGLVVEANGGRVLRRNTLEDRLERSRRFVQTDVAKALFA